MEQHPITDLLKISMDNIKEMIDVNIIVGDTINVNQDTTIIPISKVKCTFLTGGTEQNKAHSLGENEKYPFGGAVGGSVTVTPVAFLVNRFNETKLLHLEDQTHIYEKIIDTVPETIEKIKKQFLTKDDKDL